VSRSYRIDSPDGAEAVGVEVKAPTDPTGTPIEFGILRRGLPGRPTVWTAGTWGTWVATGPGTAGYALATSPTFGAEGSVPVDADTTYRFWIRPATGTESPDVAVGVLAVGS
jgi:hypothetical protein